MQKESEKEDSTAVIVGNQLARAFELMMMLIAEWEVRLRDCHFSKLPV